MCRVVLFVIYHEIFMKLYAYLELHGGMHQVYVLALYVICYYYSER